MSADGHLSGEVIAPRRLTGTTSITELVEGAFGSFNAGRLREGCRLMVERVLEPDVVVGVTLTGALTPAGLGVSTLIPLIEAGFIDWIVTTGGNLFHDAHFGLGQQLHQGSPFISDHELREADLVRIYDILFERQVLLDTDAFFRRLIEGDEFQRRLSSAEFHHLCGRYLAEREAALGTGRRSLLAACYEYDVPLYTPAPGDSSIGMAIAAAALQGSKLQLDPSADLNESAAILLAAKSGGNSDGESDGESAGRSAVLIVGGGSPKNFILQIESYLQEVLGIDLSGHDYFLQITEARPDSGSLSGAPAVEEGERPMAGHHDGGGAGWSIPDAVTCYADATIVLPILAAYMLANRSPREPRRLYRQREESLARLGVRREAVARDPSAGERVRRDAGRHITLERNR